MADKLQQLLEKRGALDAQIRREQARKREQGRKADTRRKILAGAAVLDEAEQRPEKKAELLKLLNSFLVREDDRMLFGFDPLPGSEVKDAEAGNSRREPDSSEELPGVPVHEYGNGRSVARH